MGDGTGDLNAGVDTDDGVVSGDLGFADETRSALDPAFDVADSGMVGGTSVGVPVDEFEVGFCTRTGAEPTVGGTVWPCRACTLQVVRGPSRALSLTRAWGVKEAVAGAAAGILEAFCFAGTNVVATFGTWVSACSDVSGTAARTVFISRGAICQCFLLLSLLPNLLSCLPPPRPWLLGVGVGCGLFMGSTTVTVVDSVTLSPFTILCWILVTVLVIMAGEVISDCSCVLVGCEGASMVVVGQDGIVFVEPLMLPAPKARRGEAKDSEPETGAWVGADTDGGVVSG